MLSSQLSWWLRKHASAFVEDQMDGGGEVRVVRALGITR